jgi:hypothetical protein
MKRIILLFLVSSLPVWAVTRTVTISAPATVIAGTSITVPTSASTDATDSEQIGFYHAEYSTNGGSTWTGFCYDVNVGKSATRNAYITAGSAGTQIKVRVRIAFRGGGAGDVDYNGGAINWGGSWNSWGTPPTKYATINVVANTPPTVAWQQNQASAPINTWIPIQAKGEDVDGNLSMVLVWREWVPHAFTGATNGYLSYSDANLTTSTTPANVQFQGKADDSAGANSGYIYHTVAFNDVTAPTVPGGLSASNVTTASFDLSWNASSDDVAVTSYEVRRNGTSVGTTTGTTYNFTGLSGYVLHTMAVRARDAAGNWSAWSADLHVDPDADGDSVGNALETLLGMDPDPSPGNSAQTDAAAIDLKIHQPSED